MPMPTTGWTLETLLAAEAAGEALDWLLFWGHTPPEDGSLGKHVLSQWFMTPFEVEGVSYASAEHYMMAGKARLFGDEEALAAILVCDTPAEAKALGRRVRNFEAAAWDAASLDIVTQASVAKFRSTPALKAYLRGTGEQVLVEAAPRDRIWGIGMGRNNPNAVVPSKWRGKNKLGFALMRARAILGDES